MAIKLGQLVDKISETRSKLAVFQNFRLHLQSNYLSTEAGEPEQKIFRGDYAPVPEVHVHASIAEIDQQIAEFEELLKQLEGTEVDVDTGGGATASPKKKFGKKEKTDGTEGGNPARASSS